MKRVKIFIAILILPMMVGCSHNPIELKQEELTIEYGTNLGEVKEYLQEEKMDADVISNTKMELPVNEEGKSYPAVGNYKVSVYYEDYHKEIQVHVTDTVKPVFAGDIKKTLETYKDVKIDFTDMYKAEDLSEVKITIDDHQVDYTKEGNYEAAITAIDSSGNTEMMTVTVKVNKPTIQLEKSSLSMYVKASQVLDVNIKGKDDKATWKSSDSSVATISESGKVTAKKVGTTTITAMANGEKATCKVTVKNVPTQAKTTTKTVTNKATGKQETITVITPQVQDTSPQTSQDAFRLINAERKKAGVAELQWNSQLASLAKTRAKEITVKFDHTRPDGSDLSYIAGENIAYGYSSSSSVVKAWMNSEGHRWNILNSGYATGTVAYCRVNGTTYWVALFQ